MRLPFPVLKTHVREAVRSLRGARLRTVLGLIGITIGIGSVIAMISVGEIATAKTQAEFEALGTDIMSVQTSGGRRAPSIALEDALALAGSVATISEAAPRIEAQGGLRHAGKRIGRGSVQGVTAAFARVTRLALAEGRFISDLDYRQSWCVVGARVAAAMRRAGASEVMGATIEGGGRLLTVVGVLEPHVEGYSLPFQVKADESVFVPIATAQRMEGASGVRLIVARSAPGVHYMDATRDVESYFRERAPRLEPKVTSARQLIERMKSQMQIMTLLLATIGGVSLIVGGIGVMNIMLVTVSERCSEIGIRRALGARRGDIQGQFLVEAVMLSVVGGVFGVLVGTGVTWGVCRFTDWDFFISTTSVAVGLGVSSAVGIFFGFQPARQAARVDPIIALQGE